MTEARKRCDCLHEPVHPPGHLEAQARISLGRYWFKKVKRTAQRLWFISHESHIELFPDMQPLMSCVQGGLISEGAQKATEPKTELAARNYAFCIYIGYLMPFVKLISARDMLCHEFGSSFRAWRTPHSSVWLPKQLTVNTAAINYNKIKHDSHLPGSFHGAGQAMQSVQGALQRVQDRVDADPFGACLRSLTACNAKAKLSQEIFMYTAQAPTARRLEAYGEVVKRNAGGRMIELLARGMMADLRTLGSHSTAKGIMEVQMEHLWAEMERLSEMEPSISETRLHNNFSSHGSGNQFNATGGTQNNNTGSGYQFSGATFTGPVNFGQSA